MADADKTNVLMVTGGEKQSVGQSARLLNDYLERTGRHTVSQVTLTSRGAPALANLADSKFNAVLIWADHHEPLPNDQASGLAGFLKRGGGLVTLHHSPMMMTAHDELAKLVGVRVQPESFGPYEYMVWPDAVCGQGEAIPLVRTDPFQVRDFMPHVAPSHDAAVFAVGHIDGKPTPLGLSCGTGEGRLIYLAPGGSESAGSSPYLHRMVERSLRVVTGAAFDKTINAGIIGYGGAFNMGKHHAEMINAQTGMATVAVCDLDPKRLEAAQQELGEHIQTYAKAEELLADDSVDLVIVILPHDLHARTAINAAEAGRHVIVEKPLCTALADADAMIAAAREAGVMLSCFNNRRWDGDFQRILSAVRGGHIGDVFHADAASGNYAMPGFWWRSSRQATGGIHYDWGAHYVDWLMNIMDRPIESVSGITRKVYWGNTSNEDYVLATIRFADGATATLEQGTAVAVRRAGWRILGTRGGLTNEGPGKPVTMIQRDGGSSRQTTLEPAEARWQRYYQNIANHLIMDEQLVVTAAQARRVIGILELAEKSSRQGGAPLPLAGEGDGSPEYLWPW